MDGLYALKPWYARRLRSANDVLADADVSPSTVTWSGVGLGAAAGAVLGLGEPGLAVGVVVTGLVAARLACANLDGTLARTTDRTTRRGAVANELGDRMAELAVLAGCLTQAPAALVALAAFASLLPSWVALAGASAGAPRLQGGPLGKTERAALLCLIAFTGLAVPLLVAWVVGCAVTAAVRLVSTLRILGKA